MDKLQHITNFLVEAQETGLRALTQEELAYLAGQNLEIVVVHPVPGEFNFVISAEKDIIDQINDEELSSIHAAKASDCAASLGSVGSGATLSSLPVGTILCASSIGSVGSASTASSGQTEENSAVHIKADLYDVLTATNIIEPTTKK